MLRGFSDSSLALDGLTFSQNVFSWARAYFATFDRCPPKGGSAAVKAHVLSLRHRWTAWNCCDTDGIVTLPGFGLPSSPVKARTTRWGYAWRPNSPTEWIQRFFLYVCVCVICVCEWFFDFIYSICIDQRYWCGQYVAGSNLGLPSQNQSVCASWYDRNISELCRGHNRLKQPSDPALAA